MEVAIYGQDFTRRNGQFSTGLQRKLTQAVATGRHADQGVGRNYSVACSRLGHRMNVDVHGGRVAGVTRLATGLTCPNRTIEAAVLAAVDLGPVILARSVVTQGDVSIGG